MGLMSRRLAERMSETQKKWKVRDWNRIYSVNENSSKRRHREERTDSCNRSEWDNDHLERRLVLLHVKQENRNLFPVLLSRMWLWVNSLSFSFFRSEERTFISRDGRKERKAVSVRRRIDVKSDAPNKKANLSGSIFSWRTNERKRSSETDPLQVMWTEQIRFDSDSIKQRASRLHHLQNFIPMSKKKEKNRSKSFVKN